MSDIDVFGCEVDLIELDTQLPLPKAFHTALLQQKKLQIVVWPCMVEGHSIWQFQADDRESYPKAIRVPVNPRREIADRAFYAAPMLRHVEIAAGIQHVGFAAWEGCQQLQIVKLPPLSPKLRRWSFPRLLCPSGGCGPGLRPVQSKGVCGVLLPQQSRCRQTTAMFLHQGRSWADMLSRAVSRLHPSPLQWTKPTSLERCLKVQFAAQALKTSVSQATFTTSDRGLVKTASDLWKSISCAQRSQPYSTPPSPNVWP